MANSSARKSDSPVTTHRDLSDEQGLGEAGTALADERQVTDSYEVADERYPSKEDQSVTSKKITYNQEHEKEEDGVLWVDWNGPDDPANPRK